VLSFCSPSPPERYGLPAQAQSPVQENVVPATMTAVSAGLLAAGVALAFVHAAGRQSYAARLRHRRRW